MSDNAKTSICDEILRIMQVYDEQEAKGNVDTPGGLEHMGDVWKLLDGWRRELQVATPDLERATEMPMNDCGLMINVGRDGTWLHFTAKSGKSAGINVENWANSKDGGITAQTLRDWAADRREQAASIGSSRG